MHESLAATLDPAFQTAAQIAGFAEAIVVETPTGRVVIGRYRWSTKFCSFAHLAPGECAANAFFGCAFWERADVLAAFFKNEEGKKEKRGRLMVDVQKDFRTDLRKLMAPRPDGKNDVIEALGRMRALSLRKRR